MQILGDFFCRGFRQFGTVKRQTFNPSPTIIVQKWDAIARENIKKTITKSKIKLQ
jgi:hypothetical protein